MVHGVPVYVIWTCSGMGDCWLCLHSIPGAGQLCEQPLRSTQPGHPFVARHSEYQPKGGDALQLGSKGRYGSCVGGRSNCVIPLLHSALEIGLIIKRYINLSVYFSLLYFSTGGVINDHVLYVKSKQAEMFLFLLCARILILLLPFSLCYSSHLFYCILLYNIYYN